MSSERQITHWAGCWREHHECAVALFSRITDALADHDFGDEVGALDEIDSLLRQGQLYGPTTAACSDGLCRHAREATPPSTLPR